VARKDVTDEMVCMAYMDRSRFALEFPYDILMRRTGEPFKVCYRAMERANDRGYIEYGVSLRTGWLTEKGWELIGR
jgi:hypothetical protein